MAAPVHHQQFGSGLNSPAWSRGRDVAAPAALAAAHVPLAWEYAGQLWAQPHYQFFPLALAAGAYLVATRGTWPAGRPGDPASPESSWTVRLLCLADLLLLALAVLLRSPWLAACGAWLLCLAVCRSLRDRQATGSLAYLTLLPLLLIRPPLKGDQWLIAKLQTLSTQLASNWLHASGYAHFRAGNVLEFPTKAFLVEEACSGMHSLLAVLFLAVLLAVWKRRSATCTILLAAAAVVGAAAANLVRILLVAVAWSAWGVDLSAGWPHDVLGYALMSVTALLLLSIDQGLQWASAPIPWVRYEAHMHLNPLITLWNQGGRNASSETAGAPLPSSRGAEPLDEPGRTWRETWNRWRRAPRSLSGMFAGGGPAAWSVAVVASLLLLAQAARIARPQPGRLSLAAVELPRQLGGQEVLDFQRSASRSSELRHASWRIGWRDHVLHVTCDFPFRGWHGLTDCYLARGWTVEQQRVARSAADPAWACVAARLRKPTGEYGYLAYSFFDAGARPVAPPEELGTAASLRDRLRGAGWLADRDQAESVQVQTFVQSPAPLPAAWEKDLLARHRELREDVRRCFTRSSAAPGEAP